MMQILDGKKVSAEMKEEIANEVKQIVAAGHKAPHLMLYLGEARWRRRNLRGKQDENL